MNTRGNKHSRSHVKFNPDKDNDFWDFSFHEMAAYDVPAVIKHVQAHTGAKKVTYVGHSQGTLQAFAGNTLNPNFFRDNVNGVIALGPVTSLANIGSSFIALAAKSRLDSVLYYMGMRELLPSVKSINEMVSILCDKLHLVCDGVLELISDGNAEDDDQDKFQVFLSKFPSGTSVKDLTHFAQYVRSGKFAQYDYGKSENQKRYGRDTPPDYDISKIQNKICLFVGTDDKLATLADNRSFKSTLEKIGKLTLYQEIPKTGHLTFFIPKDFSYFQNFLKCLAEFEK